jgi:hypothetical protein
MFGLNWTVAVSTIWSSTKGPSGPFLLIAFRQIAVYDRNAKVVTREVETVNSHSDASEVGSSRGFERPRN